MVIDLAVAFNYRLPDSQLESYVADISEMNLTEAQLDIVARQAKHELDRFPSLAQLWEFGHSVVRTRNNVEPIWVTSIRNGKVYARKAPGVRGTVPSDRDLEQWKREMATPDEGRRVFADAFIRAGGDLGQLEIMQRALIPDSQIQDMTDYEIPDEMLG
jgi:hypothetical protein